VGVGEQLPKGVVIAVLVKDRGAGVAAIDDVIATASLRGTSGAWHGAIMGTRSGNGQQIVRA
jgi:hypothetical protein